MYIYTIGSTNNSLINTLHIILDSTQYLSNHIIKENHQTNPSCNSVKRNITKAS